MVQQLIAGLHRFRRDIFREQRELFERLEKGQSPETLFITCSDSRIDPNLITHTEPGDLFVVRNAGNIVPAYAGDVGGEIASIEFAVTGLGVRDIVICGHSHCGAMKGLLKPESLSEMPAVAEFLKHAEATRRIVRSKYAQLTGNELVDAAIEENVLVQLENLQTHPAVAEGIGRGQLKLHGWVYDIGSGEVYAYDPTVAQFVNLAELRPPAAPPPKRVVDTKTGDARFDPGGLAKQKDEGAKI